MRSRLRPPVRPPRSAFAGYRFPPEVISVAVRWYLRFGLSYRDVEELLAERGIEVDHVTIYRWVQRFAPEFAEAARVLLLAGEYDVGLPPRNAAEYAGLFEHAELAVQPGATGRTAREDHATPPRCDNGKRPSTTWR